MELDHKVGTFKLTIKFEFKMDPETWQALDTQEERYELSQLSDHTELFKQFSDNPSFKKWLSDTVFGVTYQA